MTFGERLGRLRRIPLAAVLRESGAQRDRYDRTKWHTPQGAISITGLKFMNWHRSSGGGGAIDLAMHLNGFGFPAAVAWLERHFLLPTVSAPQLAAHRLALPPPDRGQLSAVRHYLIQERAILPSMTDALIASGTLYADRRSNAVFLLLGKGNIPVGAELRGTGPQRWRGMAPGSQRDLGYFSVHAPGTAVGMAILCESAIDAISCFLLHPTSLCLSTSGARSNPRWLSALLSQGIAVYCGFDADATGDVMAQQMIALHPSLRRLRPSQHDWNDVLKCRHA